jgi:hypothetical protein
VIIWIDAQLSPTLTRWIRETFGMGMSPGSNSSLHGNFMRQQQSSRIFLSAAKRAIAQQQELFALLNLGLVQSLAGGIVSSTEAVERFYHAQNCLYVQKHFRQKAAHTIMSHGVQLPDLFESLLAEEAQREFYHELEIIRSLCFQLLEKRRASSVTPRAAA